MCVSRVAYSMAGHVKHLLLMGDIRTPSDIADGMSGDPFPVNTRVWQPFGTPRAVFRVRTRNNVLARSRALIHGTCKGFIFDEDQSGRLRFKWCFNN